MATSSAQTNLELALRSFLRDELAFELADSLSLDDPLEIDSVDQVELRVFMEETFGISLREVDGNLGTLRAVLKLTTAS